MEYFLQVIHPPISITRNNLTTAHSINDWQSTNNNLQLSYNPSWIQTLISIEISACINGQNQTVSNNTTSLSPAQKELLINADNDSKIDVTIHYMPNNNLSNNQPQVIELSFVIAPQKTAQFPGGMTALELYFEENVINHIPCNNLEEYDIAIVEFTVDTKGNIINAQVAGQTYNASQYQNINNILLTAVKNMPQWQAAQYADGSATAQKFVAMVGNMTNCVTNVFK